MSFIKNLLDAVQQNLISGTAYYLIAKAIIVTAAITVLSLVIAAVIGILFSYFMAYEKKVISVISSGLSFIFRSTPVLLGLLFMYYVVFKSINLNLILLSSFTIGLYGAGHLSEILARQIDAAKKYQDEAVVKRLQKVFLSVTMPQTVEDTIFMIKRLVIQLLQWTTVVGYITVNDLTEVMNRIGQRTMYPFFSIAFCIILYWIATIIIEVIFHQIEKRIDKES